MTDTAQAIKKIDQLILANSGVDSFEEVVKMLVLKLYDEVKNNNTFFSKRMFQYADRSLKDASMCWPGVVKETEFRIPKTILARCLEEVKNLHIFYEDISVFDAAIEHLHPHTHRGNRGQFMTPRHIAAEIMKMLTPCENERIIDPACGTGGFLEHAILSQKQSHREKYAKQNIHGMDYDEKMTRITRLVCLKNAATKANILCQNTLTHSLENEYDVVVSNPPYGGVISEESILKKYSLAKGKRKEIEKRHRHILFIERCIRMAKPGGRIALILPQGVLNNARMSNVHKYIFANCRLIGVISLSQNTFMPHTNVKTSIVILEKWNKKKMDDYKVFMSISQKCGKDRKGKLVYKKNMIDHDLLKIRKDFEVFKKEQHLNWQ